MISSKSWPGYRSGLWLKIVTNCVAPSKTDVNVLEGHAALPL